MQTKTILAIALAAAFAGANGSAFAQVPAGYPADYQKIIDAAKKEGKVVIYSATDSKATQPLITILRHCTRASRSSTTT